VRLSARLRAAVIARAAGRCEYCRSPDRYAPDPFPIDHVQPRSRGGDHTLANLAYACAGCNERKYVATEERDPTTGEMVLLFHPRQHRWDEHFDWSADSSEILGRTPTGRATIARLDMNRPRLVALRRLLRVMGEHPPPESSSTG
jgi:hypothetical protein